MQGLKMRKMTRNKFPKKSIMTQLPITPQALKKHGRDPRRLNNTKKHPTNTILSQKRLRKICTQLFREQKHMYTP
jgi:hypothetical protein